MVSDFKQTSWEVVFEVDYPNRTFTIQHVVEQPGISPLGHYAVVTAADELGAFRAGVIVMERLGFIYAREPNIVRHIREGAD